MDTSIDQTMINRHSFPKGFIFGAATSSYQVEGAFCEGAKSLNNWDTFTMETPSRTLDYSTGCIAIDHYHKYREDVDLMKELGIDAYRFSISWSRILPGGRVSAGIDRDGIKFYNDLIDLLISKDVMPVATIFHFDVPQCLEMEYGGFLDRRIMKDFVEYAEVCFKEFGDRVKIWITENEPWTFTHNGYIAGNFPPGHGPLIDLAPWTHKLGHRSAPIPLPPPPPLPRVENCPFPMRGKDAYEPYIVAHNLILAHAMAVQLYRNKYQVLQGGKIGVTNMTTWYDPYNKENPDDVAAASRAVDFMWGWFVAPIVTGDYPPVMRERVKERLPVFTPEETKMIKGSYDFIGLNYYTTYWAANKPNPPFYPSVNYYTDQGVEYLFEKNGKKIGPQAASSWLYIVPHGIHSLLKHTHDKYNSPLIYITENGMDDKNDPTIPLHIALADKTRIKYHRDHLRYVKKAIDKDHVKVQGYFAWSMFDNFEWSEGYTVRFGMVFVEYNHGLKRIPKHSFKWYKKFLDVNQPQTSNKREAEDEEEEEDEENNKRENKKSRY